MATETMWDSSKCEVLFFRDNKNKLINVFCWFQTQLSYCGIQISTSAMPNWTSCMSFSNEEKKFKCRNGTFLCENRK